MNKWSFWGITGICILMLWFFQYVITVNVPWWDDFHGIMLPVHDLFTDKSFSEKFLSFASLNNEHRVVNDRIFTLLVFLITDKFELKILAMLGFLNLLGIFWILFKAAQKKKLAYLDVLPVVFLVFQAQYYESLQSLMVPFQNFSVILYMALSLYFLVFKDHFKLGFLFAVLAILSHGNGILVFILGALILLVNRDFKRSLLWTALSILTIFIYFLGYSKPEWTSESVVSPLDNPIAAIRYGLEFLGAYSLNVVELSNSLNDSELRHYVPQIVGLLTIIILIFLLLKVYPLKKESLIRLSENKVNLFLLAFMAFFLATAVLMGLTRTGFAVLSRYTINSAFFMAGLWLFYAVNFKFRLSLGVSLVLGAGLFLTYYNTAEVGIFKRDNAIADGVNFQINGTWSNQYSDSSHVSRLNPLLLEPLKAAEYVFPKTEFDDFVNLPFEIKKENLDFSIVDTYLMISGVKEREKEVWFSIESDQHKFIMPVRRLRENPLNVLRNQRYFSDAYRAIFPLSVIPSSDYTIFKIERVNGVLRKYKLQRVIRDNSFIL